MREQPQKTVMSPDGLSSQEASRLLERIGPNTLPVIAPPSIWRRLAQQFRGALIYLLLFALVFDVGSWLYHGAGDVPLEALAIAAVLLLNAGLGAFQEHRSEAALAKLALLAAPEAWVLRDGAFVRLPSSQIVPGDIVRLESGDRVPADGVVLQSHGLLADESIVTGESLPVEKPTDSLVQSGTLAVRGSGRLRVTETGLESTMGRLAALIGQMDIVATPLERRLDALGHRIARWVGGLAGAMGLLGIAVGGFQHIEHIVLLSVALAVAAVPEGMPAMVTLTLALGVQRMARKNAVVRRLSAVETLGSVTVIATDKTGTLTENRMAVQSLESDDSEQALEVMVMANDADVAARAGDPLDVALLDYAEHCGIELAAVYRRYVRTTSRSFDSTLRFMRVTAASQTGTKSFLKGAPEVVLERSDLAEHERADWLTRAESAAASGFRVVALASSEGEQEDALRFLGLVSLWDPPRPGVERTIRAAREAGVRIVMITGDHPGTSATTAKAIGLPAGGATTGADVEQMSDDELRRTVRTCTVFARVSPEQKLRLIDAFRANGEVVGMVGDGVNDAPALKRADVGIAMGQRGSDVAREVSDIVLVDDELASIVAAIEEGRNIYRNIQTFIRFTFSTNVALVIVVVVGAAAYYVQGFRDASGAMLLPLTALQLLWINFLGDGPPALALALDRTPDVMRRAPRPAETELIDRGSARFILTTGLAKGLLGAALMVVSPLLGATLIATQTGIFLYESVAKLLSAYASRRWSSRPRTNVVLHACIGLGIALQVATLFVPALRALLGLELLDGATTVVLGVAICITWAFAELMGYKFGPGRTDISSVG